MRARKRRLIHKLRALDSHETKGSPAGRRALRVVCL